MGIFLFLLILVSAIWVVIKTLEVIGQGIDYCVPPLRLLDSRWGVTQRGNGKQPYVFKGRLFAFSKFVEVGWRYGETASELNAAKMVAKYANDNQLKGLPPLDFANNRMQPADVLDELRTWHESGGGKGGRVIEV